MRAPSETAPPGDASSAPEPAHRSQVEALAGFGLPEAGIARALEVHPDTLRQHYGEELESGQLKANARVAESLFRKATGDGRQAVTAAIFRLKTRAGWKEASSHTIAGSGPPIRIEISADDANL